MSVSEGGNLVSCQVTSTRGSFPVLAMIDTGNDTRPSGIIMTHTFVKVLGLPMIPVPAARVNTASEGSSMTVGGQVKSVKMFLAGEYVVENVLVLEGLSHSVNIGLRFLQQNYATIHLSPRAVTLSINQLCRRVPRYQGQPTFWFFALTSSKMGSYII